MAAYQSVFRAKLFEGQAGIVTGAGQRHRALHGA